MRRNWPFFKDSDWLILVFVHSAKPTAELENLAMSPSLSSPGLSYDTKFVHIGWELRSSLVGDTILGVQSEPACRACGLVWEGLYGNRIKGRFKRGDFFPNIASKCLELSVLLNSLA